MALNIRNPEADQLARRLAAITGESISEAVLQAIRERLSREAERRHSSSIQGIIDRMQERIARLPVQDQGSDEEILGYDSLGHPDTTSHRATNLRSGTNG